jgi:multiple sugar transport system substrate-binding protein
MRKPLHPRRRATLFSTAAAALMSTLTLTGAAGAQDVVQLKFRQFDPPTEIAGLIAAVDAWNAKNPKIQVKLETMGGGDTLAQLAREVPAGAGPDVQQLAFVWTRDLARSKLLMDLDPLIKEAPPGNGGIGDFLAPELATLDGKIYGIPWSADTFAVAYRSDLLTAAGVKFPDSWADLATAAKALSNKSGQHGFCFPAGSAPDGGMWILANYYLWSNGTTLLEEATPGQWKVSVSAEALAGAMDYFKAFFTSGSTPESLITVNAWGDPELVGGLGRGDCAMAFFPPQTFRAAQGQSKSPLMTAPIPKGSVKRISHMGGRALGINPNTKHPKEAWAFLRYLAGPETFKTYNQYPAQRSLIASLAFPPAEQGYLEMLPLAQTFERYISSPIPVSSMTALVNREFGAVFSGQRTSKAAADAVVAELQKLLVRGKN